MRVGEVNSTRRGKALEPLARLAEDSVPYSTVPDPLGVEDLRVNVYYPEFTDPVRYGMITPEEGVVTLRERANEILSAANQSTG